MVEEDAQSDQMFVKIDKPHMICGVCKVEMESPTINKFKCPKCNIIFTEDIKK